MNEWIYEVVKFQNALGDSRFAARRSRRGAVEETIEEWWNRSSSDPRYGPYWTPLADVSLRMVADYPPFCPKSEAMSVVMSQWKVVDERAS